MVTVNYDFCNFLHDNAFEAHRVRRFLYIHVCNVYTCTLVRYSYPIVIIHAREKQRVFFFTFRVRPVDPWDRRGFFLKKNVINTHTCIYVYIYTCVCALCRHGVCIVLLLLCRAVVVAVLPCKSYLSEMDDVRHRGVFRRSLTDRTFSVGSAKGRLRLANGITVRNSVWMTWNITLWLLESR